MAYSLQWVVHSACHVLGYPNNHKVEETRICHGERLKVVPNINGLNKAQEAFQMPLHYPRYTKADYDNMDEWKLDLLLAQYGLSFDGGLAAKRDFAKGAFLWPDQY